MDKEKIYTIAKAWIEKDHENSAVDWVKLMADDLSRRFDSELEQVKNNVPMQKCPKCDGQGIVSKPPWIAGDQHTWDSTSISHQCDVCSGQKIIPMVAHE